MTFRRGMTAAGLIGTVIGSLLLMAGARAGDEKASRPQGSMATVVAAKESTSQAPKSSTTRTLVAANESASTAFRPSWLSEKEQKFLDSTGGLRPIASYDGDTGTVTIKLKKSGLTADQIYEIAVGPKYDYYKRTDLVETSFKGSLKGKDYLFTGTVAKKYVFGKGIQVAFVPVVSSLSQQRDAKHINITWEKADQVTGEAFMNAHMAQLEEAMKGAGVKTPIDEYKQTIVKALPDTAVIWGQHDYYFDSGYYIYQQKVRMSSSVANLVTSIAGEGDLKGAALKVAYQVMRVPKMAGPPNELGPEVVDMSGATITSGR